MTNRAVAALADSTGQTTMLPEDDRAWYLYGITCSPLASPLQGMGADLDVGPGGSDSLVALEYGELAAIVRPVDSAQFSAAALEERLRDMAALEAAVRGHDAVIKEVHSRQVILPAKFGCVYAHAEDVVAALRRNHVQLLEQLRQIEGCDEWAIHIYANRAIVARRAEGHPRLQQIQREVATARPGRAYFLARQLAREMDVATDRSLVELAQATYDRFAQFAIDSRVDPPKPAPADEAGAVEILRAAFLVARERCDTFLAEVRSFADGDEAVRCDYSGPWPPYSFAVLPQEEPQ